MKKHIKLALFGAHINSSNLGCQALTYSLVFILEQLSKYMGIVPYYYIFEYIPNKFMTEELCRRLSIESERVMSFKVSRVYKLRSYIKHYKENLEMIKKIKQCDIAIDITAGDSFSDIYGIDRFKSTTGIKRVVEMLGVPLVLGPQTYGPYMIDSNKRYARKILSNARSIIARDKVSANLVNSLISKNISYTTDLAFQLPFEDKKTYHDNIKVGINISGLLVKEHLESGIEDTVILKTDYDQFITRLIEFLCNSEQYDVTLISHVVEDFKACEKYHIRYPKTIIAPLFDNPIDIKTYISGFDIFVGARMHATIAAFTSGVATIPTAYSRKFEGLFDVVDYKRVVDLRNLTTDEAIEQTILGITNYEKIQQEVLESLSKSEKYNDITRSFFEDAIKHVIAREK